MPEPREITLALQTTPALLVCIEEDCPNPVHFLMECVGHGYGPFCADHALEDQAYEARYRPEDHGHVHIWYSLVKQ